MGEKLSGKMTNRDKKKKIDVGGMIADEWGRSVVENEIGKTMKK